MDETRSESLEQHFKKSFPIEFITYLLRRQQWIYGEARQQCFSNPVMGEVEAKWLLGYTVRAIFESELRKAAVSARLRFENADNAGGNCSCVKVFAGNFQVTAHHVSSPGYFVRESVSRKQDAAVNEFLDGYVLEGALSAPLPAVERAEQIGIYLLHGETKSQDGSTSQFLQIAAPDCDLESYRWQCSLQDLRQRYIAAARATEAPSSEDKAKPKPKEKKRKDQAE